MIKTTQYTFQTFDSIDELQADLQALAQQANDALSLSYSPYSKFKVGAAILLHNGQTVKAANQENASFSMTICAERTALGIISSLHPQESIKAIAVAYTNDAIVDIQAIISPCGACRQSILEARQKQDEPIGILMLAPSGKSVYIEDINLLLPFAFTGEDLPL